MIRARKIFIFLLFLLVCIFLLEAVMYVEKERLRAEIYGLREDVIALKLKNRALKAEIEESLSMEAVKKWALRKGLKEPWNGEAREF
jgi:cell division protein FtsL